MIGFRDSLILWFFEQRRTADNTAHTFAPARDILTIERWCRTVADVSRAFLFCFALAADEIWFNFCGSSRGRGSIIRDFDILFVILFFNLFSIKITSLPRAELCSSSLLSIFRLPELEWSLHWQIFGLVSYFSALATACALTVIWHSATRSTSCF